MGNQDSGRERGTGNTCLEGRPHKSYCGCKVSMAFGISRPRSLRTRSARPSLLSTLQTLGNKSSILPCRKPVL